jgi:hypothetical protein
MPPIFKRVIDFNNSAAFNKACKLVAFFMQAVAVGLFLNQLRGEIL